jgi:hypothetical protein
MERDAEARAERPVLGTPLCVKAYENTLRFRQSHNTASPEVNNRVLDSDLIDWSVSTDGRQELLQYWTRPWK